MRVFEEGVTRCLDQLDDVQVWQRPHPQSNAIGNLVLHVRGSLRRWVFGGIGGQASEGERQAEFDARGDLTRSELSSLLRETVEQSCGIIERMPVERVLEAKRIQDTDTSVAYAVVSAVAHLGLHVGQIQYITKMLLGEAYAESWGPRRK
jgi:Protein of unknown function (DUF1572)